MMGFIIIAAFVLAQIITTLGFAAWHVAVSGNPAFIIMLASGVVYLAIASKVTFYTATPLYLSDRRRIKGGLVSEQG